MTKRLAVVISCVDAPTFGAESVKWAKLNSTPELTDVILLDNGSNPSLPYFGEDNRITLEENVGGNAAIKYGGIILAEDDQFPNYDVVAFVHCDLFIRELGWDKRVLEAFDADPLLALVGFVGSNEMDELGGRGTGTCLNYQGHYYEGFGQFCAAEVHGRRETGLVPAANLDHCSLVFRSSYLEQLRDVPFCPTHFYDRALAAECNYRGWHVATLGIAIDHGSGGTAGGIVSQERLLCRWLDEQGLPYQKQTNVPVVNDNPALMLPTNLERPDVVGYRVSEARFHQRYRDELRMVPYFVLPDYRLLFWSHNGRKWVNRLERCADCRWNQACLKHQESEI